MEENEFRSSYHSYNQQRCVYEKSIISQRARCQYAERFCIAEREGVACSEVLSQQQCKLLLASLRKNALFSLHITQLDDQLPHTKEIKVQVGGLLGLQEVLNIETQDIIENIIQLLGNAVAQYGGIEQLPFSEITRSIVKFKPRKSRKDK